MVQVVVWLLAAVGLTLVGLAVAIRLVPSDPEEWHVDPNAIETVDARNAHLVSADLARIYAIPPVDLARALEKVALDMPGTSRLAGDPQDLWMTYVVRSRIMGFPDYVSVRVIPEGENRAMLSIYARARFGRSDLGVNRGRVENWLAALRPFEQ